MSQNNAKNGQCNSNNFKRTRYFHGQLLGDRDFREEQIYHNEKRKLLNRMLHGWGVVCGLGITPTTPASSKIVITSGMALDCLGNEIVVCEDFKIDLGKYPLLCPQTTAQEHDPCAGLKAEEANYKYYVTIRYKEQTTDPVPVYAPGGGCEEKVCEYSRIQEGVCIEFFKTNPCPPVLYQMNIFENLAGCSNSQQQDACLKEKISEFHDEFCKQPYHCPICCCEEQPYVVLGTINLTTAPNNVHITQEMISIDEGRRYVSTHSLWQYMWASILNPGIAKFMDNPFAIICATLANLLIVQDNLGATGERKNTAFYQMLSVFGQKESDAKTSLKKINLKYQRTIELTPNKLLNIIPRALAIESIQPDIAVDLITDDKGNALFFVPVSEPPKAESELTTKIIELEAQVKKYQTRLDGLERKIEKNIEKGPK